MSAFIPIFWHRTESTGPSEIGPNLVWTGDAEFVPAKFGNGFDCTKAGQAYFPLTDFGSLQFSLSFWAKMLFSSADTEYHFLSDNWTGRPCINFWWFPSGVIVVWVWGGDEGVYCYYRFQANSFSINELVHWAILHDPSQGSGLKIVLMQDGSPLPVTAIVYDSAWTNTSWQIMFNDIHDSGTGSGGGMIFDNPKIYDHVMSPSEIAWDMAHEGLPAPIVNNAFIINS